MSTVKNIAGFFLVTAFTFAPSLVFAATADDQAQLDAVATHNAAADQAVVNQAQAATAAQYQFKNEGILGCTTNVGQSVGAMAATGGVYVPVNDAAVTINTGILVYKFCVLDPLTRKIAENATAGIAKNGIQNLTQGRGGQADFVQNRGAEKKTRGDSGELGGLTDIKNSGLTFGRTKSDTTKTVQRIAKAYTTDTNLQKRLATYACPYSDIDTSDSLDSVWHAADPRCITLFSKELYLEPYATARAAAVQDDLQQCWDWGRGFYCMEQTNGDQYTIVTPSAYVEENGLQAIQSGFRQAENVNALGEMTTALFSGLAQQIVSDSRGLAGVTQSTGNQPSYLNQLTAETGAGVRQSASNAALQVLANARGVEAQYLATMNAIATNLTTTISQLRNAESQCWVQLIPKVQTYAATQTCTTDPQTQQQTCTGGFQIQPATSTAFSQAVINAQIQPLATPAINNINASTKAVKLIDQMIAGVTTVTSLDAQRLALQQLDTLVSQRALHSQYDLTAATQQQAAVKDSMSTLVTDTVKTWADSTPINPSTGAGWCNYNDSTTVAYWANLWKK